MDDAAIVDVSVPKLESRFLEPPDFRWGTFMAADGARLRWGSLAAPQSDRICIMVGGFMEYAEKYFETARHFRERGYHVWFLDWRGQGRSHRPHPSLPLARSYDQDADDLARFITTNVGEGNRLLVAHSMGGAISLLALQRYPDIADAAVLAAPMLGLKTGPFPYPVARALSWVATSVGLSDRFVPGAGPWRPKPDIGPETSITTHDPARCLIDHAWCETRPDLRLDGPTFGWLEAAFRVTARVTEPAFLASVRTPILLGSAGKEFLVDPRAHARAAALLPKCQLMKFPAAKHELFLEADAVRDPWLAAIDTFAAAYLTRGA